MRVPDAAGFLPPQGARAIMLLAELGVPEYVEVYNQHRGEVDTAAAQGAPRSATEASKP